MNRLPTLCAATAVLLLGAVTPILAAPPTVTPSPGYDARLQESRKAKVTTSTMIDPAPTPAITTPRHHARRRH